MLSTIKEWIICYRLAKTFCILGWMPAEVPSSILPCHQLHLCFCNTSSSCARQNNLNSHMYFSFRKQLTLHCISGVNSATPEWVCAESVFYANVIFNRYNLLWLSNACPIKIMVLLFILKLLPNGFCGQQSTLCLFGNDFPIPQIT